MTRSRPVQSARLRRSVVQANDEVVDARATSQVDQAYERLEELIATLEIAPGAVLTEQSLAKKLGFGRTPIREAVQRLAVEGLVVILPRRGILVSTINLRSQLELLRLRREVERLMARYAATRGTLAERKRFQEIARQMEQAAVGNDDVGFMRLDQELNLLVARTCRNEYAQKAMRLMSGLSRRFWYQHYKQALDLPRCARLHAALAKAIASGDGNLAAAKSDALVDYIQEFTRATLEED
jgi:DNA-binding GntR family transcriptional regulator